MPVGFKPLAEHLLPVMMVVMLRLGGRNRSIAKSKLVPGTGTVTFKYDPFGRRVQKSSALGTTNYLYDLVNVIEVMDGSGNVLARYTDSDVLDEPLAMLRSGTTSYYHADGVGSTT